LVKLNNFIRNLNDVNVFYLERMLFNRKNKEIDLFDNTIVNEFEEKVASSLGVNIYSEEKEIIRNLVNKEIKLSKVSTNQLLTCVKENYEKLQKFAIKVYTSETKIDNVEEYEDGEEMLTKEKSKTLKTHGLGIGFGITYTIYFHFLINELTGELSDYLKARRIPHSNKFCKRLTNYYNEIKS